jgi:hypothetical protein
VGWELGPATPRLLCQHHRTSGGAAIADPPRPPQPDVTRPLFHPPKTASMFGLPMLFAIKLGLVGRGEGALCWALAALALALSGAGLFSSVQQLAEAFAKGGSA